MYYELRLYLANGIDYTVISSGTLEEIAEYIYEQESENSVYYENVKLFAISESKVNKSLLQVEVARIEKESNV